MKRMNVWVAIMNKPVKKPTKIDQLLQSSRQISNENSGGREDIAKGIVSALLGPASQETPSMKIPLSKIQRSPFQPRDLDNATSAKVTIIENLNRVDLSDFEKSRALPILKEHSAASTNVELAKILGCDEKVIRSLWKFQELPENVINQLMISPRVLTITFVDDVCALCDKGFGAIAQKALELAADGKLKHKGILTYIERNAFGSLNLFTESLTLNLDSTFQHPFLQDFCDR